MGNSRLKLIIDVDSKLLQNRIHVDAAPPEMCSASATTLR
jgi:hypothetical protein